ncbi:hypothetical protein B0H21DRAFT_838213 [Amylocystis lapponica]|nr:hypothetical protein B0H21DRAFT_838213 [Amylocystis lapponica]
MTSCIYSVHRPATTLAMSSLSAPPPVAPFLSALASLVPTSAFALRVSNALAVFVFCLNVHSWPFVWHLRVFRPVYYLRARYWLFRLSILFRPRSLRPQLTAAWLDSLSPIGADPFDFCVSYKTWAGPDDCDFNMHLSNSSYPKTLDCARFKAALRCYPTFFRAGGWSPLAATHFSFLREIPIFARYEVRVSLASWDSKWVYVLARYVTPARPRARPTKPTPPSPRPPRPPSPAPSCTPPRRRPAPTPPPPPPRAPAPPPRLPPPPPPPVLNTPEPDGATLHCVSVSTICFKLGRITVPPALLFACEGFAGADTLKDAAHAEHVRALRGGDLGALRAFLAGGWRAVPPGERWWEAAMGGAVEARRAAGMRVVEGLRAGLEGLAGLEMPAPVAE